MKQKQTMQMQPNEPIIIHWPVKNADYHHSKQSSQIIIPDT